MRQINPKLLQMFVAVAENKSFRQAAELLNRSQSAVSMQIKQLEDQIGVVLFHRTTRRVEPTAAGKELLTYARRALDEWDAGLRHLRDVVDIQHGTVSIACVPTVAATVLPVALRGFSDDYPGITINLREVAAHDLFESVRRREVDFGISPVVGSPSEFQFDPLFDDTIYAFASKCFFFPPGPELDIETLCAFPILLNSKSAALRTDLERAFASKGLTMNIQFEVEHTHTLIAFAAAELGVGILPKIALPEVRHARMQAVPIANPALVRSIGVVSLRGYSFSPAGSALVGALRDAFEAVY